MAGTASTDRITARAYEIYQARGRVPGHEQQDWFQAEREIEQETRGFGIEQLEDPALQEAFALNGFNGRELTGHLPAPELRRTRAWAR